MPASTANLGPGFDALGLALGLYNDIEVERTEGETTLTVEGEGAERLQALGTQNLVSRAVSGTLGKFGKQPTGLRVRMLNRIPLSRGLGSSSAAAMGGVAAAAALAGVLLSTEELLDLALRSGQYFFVNVHAYCLFEFHFHHDDTTDTTKAKSRNI